MQAVVTSGFLESIPERIRTKFQLQTGMILDFDENSPYLKATPAKSPAIAANGFDDWLASSVGLAKGRFTTDELLRNTRGED